MSFVDDLYKPEEIKFRKIKNDRLSEERTANIIIDEIKDICKRTLEKKELSGYIDFQFGGGIIPNSIDIYPENKEVYPKEVKIGDLGSNWKQNRPSERIYIASMAGIYYKQDAQYLADYLLRELKNLGFRNIIVRVDPIKIMKAVSTKKKFLDNSTYKIKYEDTGEIGYRVYFSINW